MKVILLKDVPKIGKKFELKNVSEGHALNFLIPKGLAENATPSALKKMDQSRKVEDEKRKIQEALLAQNLSSVSSVVIEFKEKANEKGHLFAGVNKEEIAEELKKQTHLDIPAEYIDLEKPIKEVGEYDVEVKIGNKTGKFKVKVEALVE
ncbi:MAG: 50S ribosomal protein L9 [Candidatus Paceibacterota bacterium]